MLGRLLFDRYEDNADTLVCYYVVLSAELFSTSVLDLLTGVLGAIPTYIDLLRGVFIDALGGIAGGILSAAKIQDVIDNLSPSLPSGLIIPTIAYLQGGTPESITLSDDYYLEYAEAKPETVYLLETSLDSLAFYGCRVVAIRYSKSLHLWDTTPPDNLLVTDVYGGAYKLYYPSASQFNGNNAAGAVQSIASIDFNLNASYCLCASIGTLWSEEPYPYNPGHYLNPYAPVYFNPGTVYNGVLTPPYLSSSGMSFSVPFTIDSPSAGVLQAVKWEKISVFGGQQIQRDVVASPQLVGTGSGGKVIVKPSKEYVEELLGIDKLRPSVVPVVAGLSVLWLLLGRGRK